MFRYISSTYNVHNKVVSDKASSIKGSAKGMKSKGDAWYEREGGRQWRQINVGGMLAHLRVQGNDGKVGVKPSAQGSEGRIGRDGKQVGHSKEYPRELYASASYELVNQQKRG
jgi:hypothetical protein